MSATLDRLAVQHPEMGTAVTALRAILGALRECEVTLPDDVPSHAAARARLHGGIPALMGEALLTGDTLLSHAELIASRLAEIGLFDSTNVLATMRRSRRAMDGEALAAMSLTGSWDLLSTEGARLGVESDTLLALFDYAARPALRAGAQSLGTVLEEMHWGRGICPACGAPPLLAELLPENERRDEAPLALRCGRCAASWGVERLRCPHCGERDHRKLGYIHVDGEQEFRRVERCDSCHGYVKALAVLRSLDADVLLEEDLATSGLDLIAVERGYHR
ncbi:MAG TPA: formate dehydrogenase accessory protein FdhE [Gemmatimonadaceae bacterium]|nr:formate dehydrogenase accessory protein FdhE [Gemmatimonadaceae bacterium]